MSDARETRMADLESRVAVLERDAHPPARNVPDADDVECALAQLRNAVEQLAEAVLRHEFVKDVHNLPMLRALAEGRWSVFDAELKAERE